MPASVEDLEREYDVVEKVPTAPAWDFMWSVVAEEGREKQPPENASVGDGYASGRNGSPWLVYPVLVGIPALVGDVYLEKSKPHPDRSGEDVPIRHSGGRGHCAKECLKHVGQTQSSYTRVRRK